MDLAVIQWMAKNRERRKKRMIRQGIVPVQCDIVENTEFKEGEGIIRELRIAINENWTGGAGGGLTFIWCVWRFGVLL